MNTDFSQFEFKALLGILGRAVTLEECTNASQGILDKFEVIYLNARDAVPLEDRHLTGIFKDRAGVTLQAVSGVRDALAPQIVKVENSIAFADENGRKRHLRQLNELLAPYIKP